MFKNKGVEEFKKKLLDIRNNLKEIEKIKSIPIDELLTVDFISYHTKFKDFKEMFEASGFIINNAEDLSSVDKNKFDEFICSISEFSSWEEMRNQSVNIWLDKQAKQILK